MDKTYKDISKDRLEEIIKKSNSFIDVTSKLGYNPKIGNIKKNIERLIKRNNISIEHFDSIKEKNESKNRYEKNNLIELTIKSYTFKDILLELDLLPISSNYKRLKYYLKKYEIDYSHIKINPCNQNSEKYNKNTLLKIVNESKTLTDVLKKLKIRTAGGNFNTLKKWINHHNIDTSHFNPNEVKCIGINKYQQMVKKSNEEVFVINSTYSRQSLKKRLYDEGLKKKECELCGQDENWKGKKMSLILDQINGIWNDSRIQNLRIVCPNCNATLDTHCGKQNSKHKKEEYLNKINEKNNNQFLRRKVNRPEYQTLIIEVENIGYSATGRKYGVSDNSIRKWIKTYEKI